MDLEHAKKLLQESNANSTYDVYIPTLKSFVPFKYMTVGHYKSMAKAVMEGLDKLDVFFAALIEELSDGKVLAKNINKVDKLYALADIKYRNTNPETDITLKCSKCNSMMNGVNILENLDKNIEFKNELVEYDIDKLNVKMTIGLPSIDDEIQFETYIKNIFEETNDKVEYERKLLNVRGLSINDQPIDNWLEYTVEQRLNVLDNVSSDYFDIAKVNDCIMEQLKTTMVTVTCGHCKTENSYISSPEDFFLF